MLDRTTSDDGYGGFSSTYSDGAGFLSAVVLDNSIEARRAAVEGVTAMYTVTTSRAVNLKYHDIFRRDRDGKIFRVTSDGDDKKTPMSATLDMRQVSAEEWKLTDE